MEVILQFIISYLKLIQISDVVDILIVAVVVYYLITWLQETRAMQLVKGIVLLFLMLFLSDWANLTVLNYVLGAALQVGMFAIVVIFQPELRSLLEKIGRSSMGKIIDFATSDKNQLTEEQGEIIEDIVTAVINMSSTKTGALIVIEGDTKLGETIRTGTKVDAVISSSLLENIFVHNTPLHDGAVIIRSDRIISAGCFLPLTSNNNLSRELGTRHRAAIGISEVSDALIIVVSEETGKISIAINGSLTRNMGREPLKKALERFMEITPITDNFKRLKFWKGSVK